MGSSYDTNLLLSTFPQLFENNHQLEIIGQGWKQIMVDLCYQLQKISTEHNVRITISLIKEKWGELRVHWYLKNNNKNNTFKELVSQLVNKAITKSSQSCWECGSNQLDCGCSDSNHDPKKCKFWNRSGWVGYYLPWCHQHNN
jgi:hypothetical protein